MVFLRFSPKKTQSFNNIYDMFDAELPIQLRYPDRYREKSGWPPSQAVSLTKATKEGVPGLAAICTFLLGLRGYFLFKCGIWDIYGTFMEHILRYLWDIICNMRFMGYIYSATIS